MVTPTIQPGDFRTQTQGGWGATCRGSNPGCYRDAHFANACVSSINENFVDGTQVGAELCLPSAE